MKSITSKPRRVKTFSRTVGQQFTVTVPAGYERMQAEMARPKTTPALTITVARAGLITSIRLADEPAARSPHKAITLEHPAVVKLLADYSPIESYPIERGAMTVYTYEKLPALVQTGPGCYIVAEPELLPQLSPAAQEAEGLKAEYPNLAKRIESALALIESGDLAAKMKEHNTEWQNLTRHGNWLCDCPDSLHRRPVAKFGRACRHCLAGEILARVKRTARRVQMQKLESDNERRSAESARRYALALGADAANLHRDNRMQFGRGR